MNTTLQRLGQYRLQERVGGNGIAEVWKAFSPQLRRYVAIKILHADLKNDPRFITRFEREAKAIASLYHPNIVPIRDFQVLPIEPADRISVGADLSRPSPIYWPTANPHIAVQPHWGGGLTPNGEVSADPNTIAYLVMDYIDGSTLADYIGNTSRKKNFLPVNEIVHLFVSICAAIDYAHSKGVIHGDIKPANILFDTHAPHGGLDRSPYTAAADSSVAGKLHWSDELMPHSGAQESSSPGRIPIVTDFGITRLLGTPAGTLSRWGLITPFYLSPKQAMGYVGDVSSDIYSLGAILYEICTGVPPFQGDSPSVIMMQHITATPTPPIQVNPAISPTLSTIILHSLDKNPKMRFPSVSALAAAVVEALGVPIPDILKTQGDLRERADTSAVGGMIGTMNRPLHFTLAATPTAKQHSLYIAPDGGLHCPPDTAALDARVAEQRRWSDGLVPRSDELMAVHVTTSNSMPDGEEHASEGSLSNWSPSQTPSSPNWPPPPTPPPTPAFPPAPTPSLLELALGRLGINPSLQRRRTSTTTWSGAMQGKRGKHRGVLRDSHLVLLAVLILLLIISSLGALLMLAHRITPIAAQQVGYVYFLSSGQLYVNNNQGIDDEVQIDLHGIAAPHPGKSYYAWLLGDANPSEVPWMLLGKVSENQGNVHFLYTGDVAHTNLLADMSRFVITEGDANTTPNNPLLDSSTWHYYGEIFQTSSPKDVNHFSMLDHIRHLLVQAPELQVLGLQGGLSTWLLQNVEEISQWALNAKEAWETKNTMLMSHQLINILYYIDGECTLADFAGMPSDMPTTPENGTIARIAHFSLINPCIQQQQTQANQLKQVFSHTPPDYVDHTLFHLAGMIQSPGATPALHTLAVQLNTAVNDVKGWLVQVRKDALRLCDMPGNQLTQLSALSVLSDLEVQVRYAYAGQTDPSIAQTQEGVTWIYDNMQRLANIDVTSYPA